MKKIIANSLFAIRTLIVVLCVICGAVPAWADAEVELKNAGGTKVNEGTWSEMIAAAKQQDGYTMVLLADVVLPKGNDRVVTKNLTVDLNGHVLSATTFDNTFNFALCIYKADKTLTIKDSQGGGKIKSGGSNGTMYGIELYSGSVVLDRVAIEVKNTHASGNSAGVHVRNTGSDLTIIGGSIQSTSEGTGYACGVYVEGSQTISITGTEVSASAKQNAHAVHTAGGELLINDGTFTTTTSGNYAYSVYSNGTTIINGGTFTAGSGGSYAYGLYSTAGKITATGATVSVSAVTSKAYAAMAKGSVTDGGVESVGELVLNNCSLTATSKTEVYGVLCNGTARNATTQDTSPRAVCGKATVNGGSISATATASSTALAIYMEKTYISPDGQKKSDAELIVRNATLRAEAKSTAYCIYAGSKTTVDGCNITAISEGETAYGVALYDGASTVTNSAITTEAGTTVACGIFASGATMSNGVPREAVVTIDNNSVQATAGTKFGYALYAQGTSGGSMVVAGKIIVNGGTYNGQAPADGETSHEGYAACCKGSVLYEGEVAYPSIVINGGRFNGSSADVSPSGEPGHFVLNGGYYVKDLNLDKKLGEGMNKVAVKSGTPEYTAGYRYRVTDNMTGETVCKVYQGTTLKDSFSSLEEALAYVNLPANSSTALTIVLCANYTLSKGDYVLPGNKTLLVPYKAKGTGKGATQAAGTDPQIVNHDTEYTPPTPLYKLTFASGVNMTVRSGAAIEASSVLYITNGSGGSSLLKEGTGIVHDKYGWIELEQGAHIDLESGAKLYAWGYITGKGEINAKSGSEVYEDFQMGDWRGGTHAESVQDNTNGLAGKGVFLITHYYYQNIECPITYRAGAKAYAKGGVSGDWLWSTINAVTNPAVQFVGTDENSMFQMDPATAGVDTWVRKEYDPETDYVNWFLNSGAELGGLTLQMSSSLIDIDVKASDYVLPITSNFNIIANYGDMTIVSDVCFIPGSKLTIKKEADVIIREGVRAYFYDQDDWSSYKGYWFCPGYSPSWQTNPRLVNIGSNTTEKMPDAEVLVEGTLNIEGAAYTTAGGANIHSTRENAGKVMFQANAPASTSALSEFSNSTGGKNKTLCQWVRSESSTVYYEGKALTSVKLKNEDNTYTSTTGTTADQNWIYMEDGGEYRWVLSYDDGCFTYKNSGGSTKQYIHPSDWVAVEANASGDHAYHSEDGTRMFINAQGPADEMGCVWWEVGVEPQIISGTTYYIANNDYFDNYGTYFYWDNTTSYWKPKKITVTWQDKDGNKITNGTFGDVYNFNTSPQFYGTDPTWPNTTTEKHEWIGWRDAEGNIYDKNATLPPATADITYTAYFVTSKYQSTITFKNDDNTIVWAGLVDHGTVPVCPVEPTKTSTASTDYTFTGWNTEPVAVTSTATYIAQYSTSTRQYTVTFYNYDAVTELYSVKVDYNARPSYNGITPFRANTPVYSYAWTGWQGATSYGTSATLPVVTDNISYIATFEQTEFRYQVFFKRPDGSIIDAGFYAYGDTPAAFPANPTMASTVSTDYSFTGWSPATLVPVTEDGMTYTAQFSESVRRYTAHFVNYDGNLLADVVVDYNNVPAYTDETPFKPNDKRNSFEFSGWSWDGGNAGDPLPALQRDMTFTAQFNPTLLLFNIIYQREDGTLIDRQKKKYGQTTTAPSVSDYQEGQYYYTFTSWTPATIGNPVTADATYTAHFNQTLRTFTVTWKNADGTTLETDENVAYGTTPTYDGATPTKTATAQYSYTFDSWSPAISSVTTDVTYTATFTETVNTYTVTWKDADGTTLETDENVPYGNTPEYNGVTPTKAKDAEYAYTFNGWSPTVSAVTGDATYTATYTTTPVVASVTANEATTYYTSFADAWTAATGAGSASTLTLLQDITGLSSSRTYIASHDFTLDLNGHTLSGSSAETSMFQINSASHTFTVTDGSANHDGKLSFSSGSGSTSHCVIVNNGTFVLKAGTIEATSSTASIGAVQVADGTFTMNENGAVHVNYTGNANGNNSRLVHAKGGTTTINGGLIRLESTKDAIGVVYSSGNVTFNGGLFNISASGTAAVTNKDAQNSNLNIRGGYYSATNSTYFNPHVKAPYHIFSNSDATYIYRVAAAYTLTWTTDGDALTGNYTSGLTEPGTTIVAPNTPTKTGYTFYGWTPAVDAAMPSADTEYTAQWAVASVTINDATTLYTDFSSAWTAANGSTTYPATIKLLQDVTVTVQLAYTNSNNQNCTLDLNGYTLTSETDSQQPLHINRSGISFTITDGTVDKSGKLSLNTSFSSSAIFGAFVDNGTLLLNGGTIEVTSSTAATCGVTANSNGTFTMNGGTIYVKTTANNKEGRGVYSVGRVIINDGTIHVEAAGTAYGIKRDGGTVTVNDGKFHISASGSANVTNHANVVIKGGYYNIDTNLETYVASPYHVFPNDDAIYRYKVAEGHTLTWDLDGGEVSVAGTPAGYVAVGDPITAPTVSKTDYTFTGWSPDVADTMPANDVTYTATWEYNGVASVTVNSATTYYTTVDAAFTAANASTTYEPTITLLKDAATTTTSMLSYTGAKNCTLNLNGHTLSSTTAQALLYINHTGITFTITDLTESKSGTLHLESTSTDNRWCVYVAKGNLQMDAGTVFLRSKANTYNEGIRIDPAASTFTMNGGKVHVETSDGKPARGIVSRGIAVINDGEIQVEASGTGYGIEARVSDDGNNIGNVTVNGGKFLVTGTTAACAYRSDARATLKLQGGYYNSDTDLATYTSAPYEVQETTAADKEAVGSEYNYKVVENDETGFSLDIVDWTASNLTINANGWTASGWPYMINDVEYAKEARAADRTLTIPYSGEAGTELRIEVQDKDDNIVSLHRYTIPFIGTTSGTSASSTIYVNSGTLTIDASETPTIAALYIRPEASVNVTNGTLTVGKLVMRTLPWQAAAISGSFTATETWYTRIAPNKRTISGPYAPITYESASYYQFALPRNCTVALKDIKVSHGANTPYGTTWLLKRYDESIRAEYGAGADNWVALTENETIQGGVGYELFSNSNYYREFYFPIGEVSSEDIGTTTAVTYHSGAAGVDHAGWNIVALPLMSVYDNRGADPETGLKVSWLLTDGSYDQGVPEYIYPAIPFSYQASEGQTVISFEGSSIVAAAPRRSMEEESVRKQWLHLDIKNANGVGDQTSILTHPTRYEETYKTGIDVAKQSFTASRPLLYSSHTYGEMAFAGVADSLLEQGVALTIYSPKPQELTISLRENNWLERLEEVWLIDMENGAQINLLDSDYNFETNEGTTRGRLFLQGRFKALNIATDIENTEATEGNSVKAQKLIIRDKLYIRINGQLYDATGKMVNDK